MAGRASGARSEAGRCQEPVSAAVCADAAGGQFPPVTHGKSVSVSVWVSGCAGADWSSLPSSATPAVSLRRWRLCRIRLPAAPVTRPGRRPGRVAAS